MDAEDFGEEGDACAGAPVLICLFRISIAFISLAFSGVIVGTFALGAADFVDNVDRTEAPELVLGRPPLV